MAASYDTDFYAWTKDQAKALRELPRSLVGDRIDIRNLATEIEDMGKRHLREVAAALSQIFENLIKISFFYKSVYERNWWDEIQRMHVCAVQTLSESMRPEIDIDILWKRGRKQAKAFLALYEITTDGLPETSPFSFDEVLSEDFDLRKALKRMGVPLR